MFIWTKTKKITCGICNIYLIIIPSQYIKYDVAKETFIEPTIEIEVRHRQEYPVNEDIKKTGCWSLQTFSDFVDGVNKATEIAVPFLKENKNFEAVSEITDTTYVRSIFVSEKVSGGMFKKGEYENVQKVRFEIFGVDSEHYVRWDKELLKPLIELRDNFMEQVNIFKQQISEIKSKK